MKITICGSMTFAKEMLSVKQQLEALGHFVLAPQSVEQYETSKKWNLSKTKSGREGARFKKKHDVITSHFNKIKKSDSILVLNYDKKGITNYIGGSALMEMAFAHFLNKQIFLLNPIPDIEFYSDEIKAMDPYIINQDLKLICLTK